MFGKPNTLGRYQFEEERAYIEYSEGPCSGAYRTLEKDNCKCLVPKDTVRYVHVQLEVPRRFSALRLDKSKYDRRPINTSPQMFTYST